MRISDWSSDVCSSDLREDLPRQVDLLDDAAIHEDGTGRARDHVIEEGVQSATSEEIDREEGDALRRTQELPQHDEVHEELDERSDHRPAEPEEADSVATLHIAAPKPQKPDKASE